MPRTCIQDTPSTLPEASRRDVLSGAAGLAVAAAVAPVAALAADPDPEFAQWMALAKKAAAIWNGINARTIPSEDVEEKLDAIEDEMEPLEEAIQARPVTTWADVGKVAVIGCYWSAKGPKSRHTFDASDLDPTAYADALEYGYRANMAELMAFRAACIVAAIEMGVSNV